MKNVILFNIACPYKVYWQWMILLIVDFLFPFLLVHGFNRHFPWLQRCFQSWIRLKSLAIPWNPLIFHEISRNPLKSYKILWNLVESPKFSNDCQEFWDYENIEFSGHSTFRPQQISWSWFFFKLEWLWFKRRILTWSPFFS